MSPLTWAALAIALFLGTAHPVAAATAGSDYESCRPGAPPFIPAVKPPDAEAARWLAPSPTARYRLEEPRPPGRHEWRLLAVGDIMTSREVLWTAAYRRTQGDAAPDAYGWAFRAVGPLLLAPDFTVGNLEFPVRPDMPAFGCPPFNGEPAYLDALKALGFDALFTANNHMIDQGVRGSETTVEELRRRGFLTLGVGPAGGPWNEILHAELGTDAKLKVAFLNYTSGIVDDFVTKNIEHLLFGRNINYALFDEHERLTKRLFGMVAGTVFSSAVIPSQAAFLDRIAERAKAARAEGARYIIAFMHWGSALAFYPTAAQRRLAQRMCAAGIDAVLGSGPHTIQPIELMRPEGNGGRECLVAYSLGNLIGGVKGLAAYGLALEITLAEGPEGIYVRHYEPHITRTVYHAQPDPERPVMIELQPDRLEAFLKQLAPTDQAGAAMPPLGPTITR